MHHPRESALGAPQQPLRALHHQDLQHVAHHQLLDRPEPVEVVRRPLLQLHVAPRSLEVLRRGQLHHPGHQLGVARLEVLGEPRDEVLLEGCSVVGVFGLLVGLVPARGGVLEAAVDLEHVHEFELGEAHDAEVLDDHLQRLVLGQPALLEQLEALHHRLVGLVAEPVEHLPLEDPNALEVELVALRAHGVALDDHEGAEDPVVEARVGVDPARGPGDQLVRPHAPRPRDALVDPLGEADQVALVDVQVGLLDVLVLLVVGDDEAGVVHDLVGAAVGLGVALVVDVQWPALEEVRVQLTLQLVVVLQGFLDLRVRRALLLHLALAVAWTAQRIGLRCLHY